MKAQIDRHTGETWIELSKEEVKYGFLIECIEAVADAENCDHVRMLERMEDVNMTEGYILAHYDVLHTESMANVTKVLLDLLHRRESEKRA